ncbi:cell wall integrity and stress response protein 1 [Bifidobacterium ramosum]|uniref:Cell wall integrity and stress response protein 1 n=1 Tax=Bifidobacterium ramosum TaxID=1798158 RepID=A0A6L4WZR5_9BIFI|nr:LytR C-terminal domain-containing protein [Bifidobacterium ramosum]KAB8287856.1 cell wall integrity and stress response protein 1 [Bifidobacterium ramosum]NEG71197.1 LytR family transcriptional regulator [Bifidobacterium ramosum]
MTKHDVNTYDSYARDLFDEPPAGPVGVHRGPRSVGARALPYVVVLIIALVAGALVWSLMTGEFSKITGLGGTSANTAQTSGTSSDTTKDDTATNGTSSDDSPKSDATNDASSDTNDDAKTNGDQSSDSTQSNDQSNQSDQSNDQSDQSSQVNKATSVRVVNAAGINGYAAQKKAVLDAAGYTAVQAANPTTSTLPTSTVVWYQNESDKATAEDVAAALGITDVQQTTGLDVPVVVVLVN